jgi:hypothetical protein
MREDLKPVAMHRRSRIRGGSLAPVRAVAATGHVRFAMTKIAPVVPSTGALHALD